MELNDFNLHDLVKPINLKEVKNIPNYLEDYKGEVVGFTKSRVKVWFGNDIYNILPQNLMIVKNKL